MRLEEAIPDTDVFYISRINTEISSEVETDPRQAENGIYVRMALLAMVLDKCSSFFSGIISTINTFFSCIFQNWIKSHSKKENFEHVTNSK